MGILDRLKGLLKGREKQVSSGIDKVSDTLERKLPAHASKIDAASDKAKDALDDLSDDAPGTTPRKPAATTPTPSVSTTATPTPSVSTPPATTPPVTEDDVTPPPSAPLS